MAKSLVKRHMEQVAPSIAAVIMAADCGAQIVRVHDVPETVDAIKLWAAVNEPQ